MILESLIFADENTLFQKTYADCEAAYTNGGFIKSSANPVTITTAGGSTEDCTFENIFGQSASCPKGWFGKADDEACYKVETKAVSNQEAAMLCNQLGADLLQVDDENEDNLITLLLDGIVDYSTPLFPGLYHIGTYQRQSGGQYYHRNGARVAYTRQLHNSPLTRSTSANCLAYGILDFYEPDYKFTWRDIPCDLEAPFICKHNPDLMGFHKLSNLVLDISLSLELPSNSLTTCLAICHATADPTHVAFILEDKCICAKGSAKYKKPIFKIKNTHTGKYLTGAGADQAVTVADFTGTDEQMWIWSNQGLENIAATGAVLELSEFSQDVVLKAADPDSLNQNVRFIGNQLVQGTLNKALGVNVDKVLGFSMDSAHKWTMEQIDMDAAESSFAKIALADKPPNGAWPFNCEKLIPCQDLPYQTCGCDHFENDGSKEKLGIVYNLGASDSSMIQKINFGSCEELAIHGLVLRGNFMIGGVKTYCDTWSRII